ncbi:hypothetical protein, partial [Pseudomonas sp. GM74]|uniref:hypothetical protein n=1 Tax=Pseudomonas sp. GM74 TaxID=1144336 RepID=UPI001930D74F
MTCRTGSRRFLAASFAQLGLLDKAGVEFELLLVGSLHFTTRHCATKEPFSEAATLEHFVAGFGIIILFGDGLE